MYESAHLISSRTTTEFAEFPMDSTADYPSHRALIRYFRESEKAGRHFMLAWLATGITSAITWRGATFFPPVIEPVFFLAMTPLTLLPYVIDRLYHRRFGSAAWVMFIFPVAATAVDQVVVVAAVDVVLAGGAAVVEKEA